MKIRQHRGGLSESMETVEEIEPTKAAIKAIIDRVMNEGGCAGFDTDVSKIGVTNYGGIDGRINWDTHMVVCEFPDGKIYPFGFTDGPLKEDRS